MEQRAAQWAKHPVCKKKLLRTVKPQAVLLQISPAVAVRNDDAGMVAMTTLGRSTIDDAGMVAMTMLGRSTIDDAGMVAMTTLGRSTIDDAGSISLASDSYRMTNK